MQSHNNLVSWYFGGSLQSWDLSSDVCPLTTCYA
uniref:Uncharacterized protein n=1 Tax=Anguilla anguilla TaxID=7936 RepID=A0A0E9PXK0_ANGAN